MVEARGASGQAQQQQGQAPRTPQNRRAQASDREESPENARVKTSSQYFRKMELLIEFKRLVQEGEAPSNILLLPGFSNINSWHGCLFVEDGPYAGGVFRFNIALPDTYPLHPPQIRLQTDCFHPLINSSGTFVLPPRPFDGEATNHEHNRLASALSYFADSFRTAALEDVQAEFVPNKDALHMLRKDPATFSELAKQSATLSNAADILYESSASAGDDELHFEPLKEAQQDLIDEEVLYYLSKEQPEGPLTSPWKGTSLTAKIREFSAGLSRLNKMGLSPSKTKSARQRSVGLAMDNPFM